MKGIKAIVGTVNGKRVLKGYAFDQYALGRLLTGCIAYHINEAKRLQAQMDAIIEDDYKKEFMFGAEADPIEIEAKLAPLNHQMLVHEMKVEAYRYVDKTLKDEVRNKPNWLGDPRKALTDADRYMVLHAVTE